MSWLARVQNFLKRLLYRQRVEQELDDEVRAYYDTLTEREIVRGVSPEEARRALRAQFQGPEQVKEKVRDARMGVALETTLQDIRYACRALKKSPGFTFFAVLTIALALGANAAIFSLVDGVLLKSSGYSDPERIVQLWEKPPDGTRNGIAAANYLDWAKQARLFDAMAAVTSAAMSYTGGGEPKSIRVRSVSAPYFDVFGIKAARGPDLCQRRRPTRQREGGRIDEPSLAKPVWQRSSAHWTDNFARRIALHRDRRNARRQRAGPSAFGSMDSANLCRSAGTQLSLFVSRRSPETRRIA